MTDKKLTGLDLMRAPFPASQISKLPKPTKQQTDAVRNDFKQGIRCDMCGGWHHPKVVHLDYVGHAAVTDRLLDCDPHWDWEPVTWTENGTPALDQNGGMWIKLTVCGQTRLGYGHPDGKTGGNAVKEVIGDALRNAAMRFGAALDLWHKGELHAEEPEPKQPAPAPQREEPEPDRSQNGAGSEPDAASHAISAFANADTLARLKSIWDDLPVSTKATPNVIAAKDAAKKRIDGETTSKVADFLGDELPY